MKKIYLGDGVYAYTDGYQIWLEAKRTNNHGVTMTHSIALEQQTFDNLILYRQSLQKGEANETTVRDS